MFTLNAFLSLDIIYHGPSVEKKDLVTFAVEPMVMPRYR